MDPQTLMQLLQHLHQQQGGQMPGMGQPQGQLPSFGQAEAPPMAQPPMQQPQQKHGGLSPLRAMSPMGGLFASNPKLAMSFMSPAFGLANLFGAFK